MRSAALAMILLLMLVPVVTGEQPGQLLPVPNEEFREILLETPRPPPRPPPEPIPEPIPETREAPQRSSRPHPITQPHPGFVSVPRPAPVAPRASKHVSGRIAGVATYYCWPGGSPPSRCTHGYSASGAYGAAGPELRAALGPHYKGHHVFVNGIPVTLIDFCACGGDHVIDVYHATWVKIPHPNKVIITWR